MLILKRLIVLAVAVISLFTARSADQYADNYADHEFPLIAAERQKPCTVRVMSYNIRCWDVNGVEVSQRTDPGVRQILEVMPDSVGLQEATSEWMKVLQKKLVGYAWVGVDRDNGVSPLDGGESCPIFYLKTRFRLLDSGNFWLSETPDVPSFGPGAACRRICTWARLQNRLTGETYVHVNTHFDHVSEEARQAGAEIVSRYIEEHFADEAVVFTADMNTTETRPAYETMTRNLIDARYAAADAVSYGTFHACSPETHADYTIDFILCSPSVRVCSYRVVTKGVDGRFTSDHFPLYADVVLHPLCCSSTAAAPADGDA